MPIDYVNLLGLILVAVAAPLLVDLLPVPDAVAMILTCALPTLLFGTVVALPTAAAWTLRHRPHPHGPDVAPG